MTYVVTEACIKCKYMDCVEVCPVDCFYEGENMLVINPDECIDCGVCEPECPPKAIVPDTEKGMEQWLEVNRDLCRPSGPTSPARARRRPTPTTFKDEPDKFDKVLQRQARESARSRTFPDLARLSPFDAPFCGSHAAFAWAKRCENAT